MPVHEGEVAVRRRTGVHRDELGSASIGVRMPETARAFLREQRMIVVGAPDDAGAVWATALTGPRGFARAVGERTVLIDAVPPPGDPLAGFFDEGSFDAASLDAGRSNDGREVGAIALEAATRRRIRINGRARRDGAGLVLTADQAYGNCPKYITPRAIAPDDRSDRNDRDAAPAVASRSDGLSDADRALIAASDTFFVATYAPGHGADVSHRGGEPGFVTVAGPRRLWWPEYRGNQMYMTLGNLELSPACGLLVVDWRTGDTLHVTGAARVDWDPARAAAIPGAERVVDVEIHGVARVSGGGRPTWRTVPETAPEAV